MNDNATLDELPELSDEDIELLHEICKRACNSHDPPFKALFGAYDQVFSEQNIEPEHDGVVFRLLLRVGEDARGEARATGRHFVDLVGHLKNILQAQGITVIDNDDDEQSVISRPDGRQQLANGVERPHGRRRVSFDDAKLDETWLSQQDQTTRHDSPRQHLLSLPPKRRRNSHTEQRTKAAREQRAPIVNEWVQSHARQTSYSAADNSEYGDNANPTLLFEPSQTQLEQNAEAFLYTSTLRTARRCLRVWHENALALQDGHLEARAIAVAHDKRTLLKQALDEWRSAYEIRRRERRIELHWVHEEARVEREYLRHIAKKALTHWAISCSDQRIVTAFAQRHMIRFRYFKRWQAIANENAEKARLILARKFVSIWREKTARRQLQEEQAQAHLEEKWMNKYYKALFWTFCDRRVKDWNESNVMRRAFDLWVDARTALQMKARQAEAQYQTRAKRRCLQLLVQRYRKIQGDSEMAKSHYDQALITNSMRELSIQKELAPVSRVMTLQVNLNLERKALQVWHRNMSLNQQATDIQRKRMLQSAWTSWNDSLRCRALAQKIDERVLTENLYRWVLQERLASFTRVQDEKLLRRAIAAWSIRIATQETEAHDAEAAFKDNQRRRRLAFGMGKLYSALRAREDSEKAALEFANARVLPSVLTSWSEQSQHCTTLNKWASDARFYTLSTRTLALWKTKTTENQQQKRRDAYAQVRARIKIRLARTCFMRMQSKHAELQEMRAEAERRAQARVFNVGTAAFDSWRDTAAQVAEMEQSAITIDQQKLLGSAFTALRGRKADIAAMDEQADAFRHESDLALLASSLKRMQWQQFTAARRTESAEALWARNRDSHVRQMLRYWFGKVSSIRTERAQREARLDEEPDSPSLRPASRAASRSSMRHTPPVSSDDSEIIVPGYMRTPSRSRRSGRFRPLPTPAPMTPFSFDATYSKTVISPYRQDENRADPSELPAAPEMGEHDLQSFTPQVTPFARKLRAGGFMSTPAGRGHLRSSVTGRSDLSKSAFGGGGTVLGGTAKSVRFTSNSRFGTNQEGHLKGS